MPKPFKAGELIQGKVQSLAFGGEGILRHHGFVIFVPFTVPEDVIQCRIVETRKSFARAELVHVLTPSPQRINPLCPYFGICGGCQLQHMHYEEQLRYKLETVKDAFKRIGHLRVPPLTITPAQMQWSYRRHITLHLRPHQKTFQAGYIAVDHKSLVVVRTCPIFNEKSNSIIEEVQDIVGNLSNPSEQQGKVTILKTDKGRYILTFYLPFLESENGLYLESHLQKSSLLEGILVSTPDKDYAFGNLHSEYSLEGLNFYFNPQTFIQNHPEQSANIYRHLYRLVEAKKSKKILDLYCGFGISSLLLAKQGHEVLGIEFNPKSIALAKQNAQINDLKKATFKVGAVEKWLPKLSSQKFDLILVNPPRTGLSSEVLSGLIKANPLELIYISCMPATLARDLSFLCQHGYQVQEGMAYDMFPQTAHVETLIYLKRDS